MNPLRKETFLICHWSALTDRKRYLEEQFDKINIKPVFIENFDRRVVSDEELSKYFNSANQEAYKSRAQLIGFPGKTIDMTKGVVCNFLNHVSAYQYIVDNNLERAFIFEDDCIFVDSFSSIMDEFLSLIPDATDMAFLGDTECVQPHTEHPKFLKECRDRLYELSDPKTCDAYMVTIKAARLLIEDLKYFNTPIDVEITHTMKKFKLKVMHLMPPTPIIQGSHHGQYASFR